MTIKLIVGGDLGSSSSSSSYIYIVTNPFHPNLFIRHPPLRLLSLSLSLNLVAFSLSLFLQALLLLYLPNKKKIDSYTCIVLGGMAADVSSLVRLINGGDATDSPKPTAPITRDLLAGCTTLDSKELDLDLQVPCGWEKRLDLKSGKVYLQRCNSSNSSSSTTENKPQSSSNAKFQDLNFPPTSKQQTLNLFDDDSLDLKLVSLSSASPTSSPYQSVCTLDKVKSALERAEKEKETAMRKRSSVSMSKSSSLPSNSSSSIKDSDTVLDQEEKSSSASFAAGCPGCLLYVLISKSNPKCPRCNSNVPVPVAAKKPRIDLNISI